MQTMKPDEKDFPGMHVRVFSDDNSLDFSKAKDLAKVKAKESCGDPMLLSWYIGNTGESYPNLECGPGDKPAWIVFAESRGGDLTVDVNQGEFVFIYLSLEQELFAYHYRKISRGKTEADIEVNDRPGQRHILREPLAMLEAADSPGEEKHLPLVWPEGPRKRDWHPPHISSVVKANLDK